MSCVTRRRPPLSPKFDHVGGQSQVGQQHHHPGLASFLPTFFYGNAVDRTSIISGGSEEVVGKVRMRLGPISLPKLKPTRAKGHKRLISPFIRSPRQRGRAAWAAR